MNNSKDSNNEEEIDGDEMDRVLDDLQTLFSNTKRAPTSYERKVFETAKKLLKSKLGVFSVYELLGEYDNDAINLLVDECLFVFTDDLFKDCEDIEPQGFIRLIPDEHTLTFYQRLLTYDINPDAYFDKIIIPKVRKKYLSVNGLRMLNEMAYYRRLLSSTSVTDTSSDEESQHSHDNDPASPVSITATHEVTVPLDRSQLELALNYCGQTKSMQEESNQEQLILNQNDQENSIKNQGGQEESIEEQMDSKESISIQRSSFHIEHRTSTNTVNDSLRCNYVVEISTCNPSIEIMNVSSLSNNLFVQNIEHDHIYVQSQSTLPIYKPIMNWSLLTEQPIGLQNEDGVTCYVNAALQCLANTPPLVQWLFDHIDALNTCSLSIQDEFCSLCEVTKVVSSVRSFTGKHPEKFNLSNIPSNARIKNNVHLMSPSLTSHTQQDVSEFLVYLLDHIMQCLPSHFATSSLEPSSLTIIDQIFRIGFVSSSTCTLCSNVFEKRETELLLNTPIYMCSYLADALTNFFKQIPVNANCETCNEIVSKCQCINLTELPVVFVINLKRYIYSLNSSTKLKHNVEYNEYLNLSPYMMHSTISNDENRSYKSSSSLYRLYAVISHIGNTTQSGHYYSYIRCLNDKWFLASDKHCKEIELNEVLHNPNATMLFYAKVPKSLCNEYLSMEQLVSKSTSTENIENISSPISMPNVSNATHSTSINQLSTTSIAPISSHEMNNDCESNTESDEDRQISIKIKKSSFQKRSMTVDSPAPGETRSTITIGTACSKKQKILKRKTIDSRSHDHEKAKRVATHVTYFSDASDVSDDSIHEVSVNDQINDEVAASKTLASIASGVAIEQVYDKILPRTHQSRLQPQQLVKLKKIRDDEIEKMHNRKMKRIGLDADPSSNENSNDNIEKKRVNVEYYYIIESNLKRYNSACAFCVRSRYFGKNRSAPTSLLLKCMFTCRGKGKGCHFRCNVYVLNNGLFFINAMNSHIYHEANYRYSRFLRNPVRGKVQTVLLSGASVYRVHAQYAGKRTPEEKEGFNHDKTGNSRGVFTKAKAEAMAETRLAPELNISLEKLSDQLAMAINSNGILKGAIQKLEIRPSLQVVIFTEASIRLYDALVSRPECVLSWDATGGVIKNKELSTKQCLYYELTMSHPDIVDEDTLVPLTFMLSENQSLHAITEWLLLLKTWHKYIFPHKKDAFPRPALLLSDRAQVFLQAALRVFNNEDYNEFLSRAYRIVNHRAVNDDLRKTNIHACLAHFMMDMRKRVNKYLPDKYRELGMWCIALLVNTDSWHEMKNNWRLICDVFLNWQFCETVEFKSTYSILMERIRKIEKIENIKTIIDQLRAENEKTKSDDNDPFKYHHDDINKEIFDNVELDLNRSIKAKKLATRRKKDQQLSNNKSTIDEEQLLNEIDSNFKHDLQEIYNECYFNNAKRNTETSSTTDQTTKAGQLWLAGLLKSVLPTIPIWSNLLVGNLSRHIKASVKAFDKLILTTHDQRTNAISERRMCIVKRNQLGTSTLTRADAVLQILIEDMNRMVESFSISYMASLNKKNSSAVSQQELKGVQDNWQSKNHRGHGHYSKKPTDDTIDHLTQSSAYLTTSIVNQNVLIPTLPIAHWLNVCIGVLLSIQYVRECRLSLATTSLPLVDQILTFLDKWISCNRRIKPPKKTNDEQKKLLNTTFTLPKNVPTDEIEQTNFILQNILIPVIDHSIAALKTYHCPSCKSTIMSHVNLNHITINVTDNHLHLERQLKYFFNGVTMTDHKCLKCASIMSLNIKLLECPPVIIVNIHRDANTTTSLYRTPNIINFQQYLSKYNIGCTSAFIYDLISFVSIISNSHNKLVVGTKIKKQWQVSTSNKNIGDGKKLHDLLAQSRIMIFERVSVINANFVRAISASCSVDISNMNQDDFKAYTLVDAIKKIENDSTLDSLHLVLSSRFTNYRICTKCERSPDSLSERHHCICIYEESQQQQPLIGIPINLKSSLCYQCSVCDKNYDEVILPVHEQIHHQYPSILMYHTTRTSKEVVKDMCFKFNNQYSTNIYVYKPLSILCLDSFNSLSVLKLRENIMYCSNDYNTTIPATDDLTRDLFDTARSIIIFFQKELLTNNIVADEPISSNVILSSVLPTTDQDDNHHTQQSIENVKNPVSFKAPIPIQLFSKSSGKLISGKIVSLSIKKD